MLPSKTAYHKVFYPSYTTPASHWLPYFFYLIKKKPHFKNPLIVIIVECHEDKLVPNVTYVEGALAPIYLFS